MTKRIRVDTRELDWRPASEVMPAGQAIRVTAVAESDEEIFYLSTSDGDGLGVYGCNPAGLRHGVTVTEETTALVHYHGAPDRVLHAEVVETQAAG